MLTLRINTLAGPLALRENAPAFAERMPGTALVEVGGMVAHISHEIACQKLAERAARKGVTCPGCGAFSTDHEYMRVEVVSEGGPQSHLVCRKCGKEFGPMEV